MQNFPARQQQIILTHASLIRLVVDSLHRDDLKSKLDEVLKISAENGWTNLVAAIRKILEGERNGDKFHGLDEEDQTIVTAILDGINNPSSIQDMKGMSGDPAMAAPGLAHLIHEAATGNSQALVMLSNMAEQMSTAKGDMSRLGGIMKRLLDGERDPDILCKGMGHQGHSLVLSILDELGRIQAH